MAFTDYNEVAFWTEKTEAYNVRFIIRVGFDNNTRHLEGLIIRRTDYLNNYLKLTIDRRNEQGTISTANNPMQHVFNLEKTEQIFDYWDAYGILEEELPAPVEEDSDAPESDDTPDASDQGDGGEETGEAGA